MYHAFEWILSRDVLPSFLFGLIRRINLFQIVCSNSISTKPSDRDKEMEEIRLEVGAIVAQQTARQTKVTHRHELTISNLSDRLLDLTKAFEKFVAAPASSLSGEAGGASTPRSVKIDFPCFDRSDPEGWLYLVEEYFAFHGVTEEAKVQMAGLHMMGTALPWIQGIWRNKLVMTWSQLVEDLRE